ncbi:protein transport protein Sec16B isoform X3 [Acipenser ruthenus]|uniref:protein transport protein Sec16B isoform X3 n=1 Tax=Acipenser ruthenus TaxID=7906 RepID=UPI002740A36A|nr:protein transport protein Sec16B isoform X3 [Acipenser ruthenus]
MDSRGYQWHDPRQPQTPSYYSQRPPSQSDYPHRPNTRDGYHSNNRPPPMPGTQGDMYHPNLDPRAGHWAQSGPREGYPVSSPPHRPDLQPAYMSTPLSRPGYHTEKPLGRSHSRQGYDYPSQNYPARDPREDYGYYDYGYQRGQHQYRDAERWNPINPHQDYWNQGPYQDRRYEQERIHDIYSEPHPDRYNEHAGSYQYDYNSEKNHSGGHAEETGGDHGELPLYGSGCLADAKASGLSSSGYELSQYIDSTDQSHHPPQNHWSPVQTESAVIPALSAPLKFPLPHVRVSFCPGGQLVRVSPNLPSQGEPALIEIHSLEVILVDTQEQEEMRAFPGPLVREDLHKVDAITFSQHRADACWKEESLRDKPSAALLWNLLVLLCRQNGRIVGSDIAELLMKDSKNPGHCEEGTGSLIDLTEETTPLGNSTDMPDLLTGETTRSAESPAQALHKYTTLLLAGRKKEALEAAMRSGLWGHALFLASKMDNRAYTTVLNRFTGSLAVSDPLQTLFQLLSGRIPAVATCCGDEKWGDWRPHLSVILSNQTGDPGLNQKALITTGDTLAAKGLTDAAHFCYLMGRVHFGVYTVQSEKLVLLGSNHSLPFLKFARTSAIQRTEVFEYCQQLGKPTFCIPSFQVYKLIYACRLLDYGLASQAFHYCEVIGNAILKLDACSEVLLGELIKLAERLKLSDPQVHESPEEQQTIEPDWLKQLRVRHRQLQMGDDSYTEKYQQPVPRTSIQHTENGPTTGQIINKEEFPLPTVASELQGQWPAVFYPPNPLPVTSELQTYQPSLPQESTAPPQTVIEQGQSIPAVPPQAEGQAYPFQFTTDHTPQHLAQGSGMEGFPMETESAYGMNSIPGDYTSKEEESQSEFSQPKPADQEGEEEQAKIQTDKGSRFGWFGWFRSKPENHPQNQASNKEELNETDPVVKQPNSTSAPPPTMIQAPTLSAGGNPFSRKAGKKNALHDSRPVPGIGPPTLTKGP